MTKQFLVIDSRQSIPEVIRFRTLEQALRFIYKTSTDLRWEYNPKYNQWSTNGWEILRTK